MNGNLKETNNSCGAGVFGTRDTERERLQLREGHGKVGDIVIVQPEDTLTPLVFIRTVTPYP